MLKKTIYLGNPAYISKQNQQLCIRRPNVTGADHFDSVPIEDIGLLVLDCAQITLTVPLLNELLKTAAILTCDDKHLPYGITLPLYAHTTFQENFRSQLNSTVPRRKQLWQGTVKAKLIQQAGLLEQLGMNSMPILKWSRKVRSGDPDNIEARGAAYYWSKLFEFEDPFIRGRYEPPPNNFLNFGYAVLRAMVARAIVGSGLSPSLGIFHRNKYNPFTLADDIMEPYRPYVDALVVNMEQIFGTAPEFLNKEHKKYLLQLPVVDTYFEGRRSPLAVAIQRTTASLVKALKGEELFIKYPTWTL